MTAATWTEVALQWVTVSRCDGPFGSGLKSDHYTDDGVRVIRLQNIGQAKFLEGEPAYISSEYFHTELARHDVRAGDLLIAGLGDESHPVGRACVAPPGLGVAMVKADCFRFRLDQRRLTHRYAAWFLASRAGRERVDLLLRGSTRTRINLSGAGAVRLPLPPVRLQNAIADFLDRKTAAIDALIAKKERLIELLEEKRQALITQAVTRGLDPNVPLKDSGIDWLGPIPAHWKAVRIKHVARLESGHTPNKETPEYWAPEGSDGVPWVSLNDTKALAASDYISETAYRITAAGIANSSARMLPARVVVFTRDATVGEAAITTVPATVSQHVIAWVCGTDVVPEYLLFAFYAMREELDRRTMGATVKTIGLNDVKALTIPLPNRAEQEAIVNRVRDAVARIRSARELVVAQLDRLREYRQALITAAVTGQIDVTADSP